ncbi:hypothetical protein LTSEHVI_2176, partial [Salmonella enterica subsp. enterica serovar Hvittingfoss str. A4-620]
MDIAVSDKLCASADVTCNNQITLWSINALTGT